MQMRSALPIYLSVLAEMGLAASVPPLPGGLWCNPEPHIYTNVYPACDMHLTM